MKLLAALAPPLLLLGCPAKPVDTGEPGEACAWYRDADADGYGETALVAWRACEGTFDGWAVAPGDCDDDAPAVHPGADEVCNLLDDDCDGFYDEADPSVTDAATWYADADADGFGDPATATLACEQPPDTVAEGGDCDDADAAVNPAAAEVCDRIDDDCDGVVDEDDALDAPTWYADADRDGYGDPAASTRSCRQPPDSAANSEDCDDTNDAVNPAAAEVCNRIDDDCDGVVDEDDALDALTWYSDTDADGYGDPVFSTRACLQPPDSAENGEDCDDTNASVNPAATELCNLLDDDCDGVVDEDDAADAPTWYADADADGFGDAGLATHACAAPAGTVADDTDCDDTNASVNPAATELCNLLDDDCDGTVDEDDAADAPTWYTDADADGYGDPASATRACVAPGGLLADGTDCDDLDPAVNPAAEELCNTIDDDCDGAVDEDDAADAPTWYADTDTDGYGDAASSTRACSQPTGYVAPATDCDDLDPAVNPAATEICDGLDDDCDGLTDDDDDSLVGAPTWYLDFDLDGYGDPADTLTACEEPSGYTDDDSDCDDGDADVNPVASEVCDGLDNDCDGSVDDGAGCPCSVQTYGGHGYLFCTPGGWWYIIYDDYRSYGYALATVNDAVEQAWLVATAAAYSASHCWWIGFNDRGTEGRWVWDSGEVSSYTNWGSGQPDNGSTGEDCAEFVASGSGLWNDEQCWTSCYAIYESP
ncbi:MAG: MopE-related protein [Pseudomonadota bacterium]